MVKILNILITGSSGQLGSQIKRVSHLFKNYNFIFTDKYELDISNYSLCCETILKYKTDLIINCAAYTNVEKSIEQKEIANLINNISVGYLAEVCFNNNIKLIHISTDFVFDGFKNKMYNETDKTNPINFYGLTKLNGELKILKKGLKNCLIIRTSWLYSESKNNFVSKILKKINNNETISVVSNEIGSPTNAKDLAESILNIIPNLNNPKTEIYHFANLGICSRFDFANEIINILNSKSTITSNESLNCKINRPKYTPLDSTKFIRNFDLDIKDWKTSLSEYLCNNFKNFN